ncbi:MAG: hypothetical protein QXR91_04645 [Nitrososphaerales archaeon]
MLNPAQERTAMLVDLILLYGPSNYSQIARSIGLPEETVRYKINVQLPRRGLKIHAIPNYFRLGLRRKIVELTFNRLTASKASEAFAKSAPELYLTYIGKDIHSRSFSLFSAVPNTYWSSYLDFLNYFVERQIIEAYSAEDVWWQRYIPFNARLFDFERGEWLFDLEKIKSSKVEIPVIKPLDEGLFEQDYLDLVILSELQFNASTPLSKIAANIGENPDNIYYHYTNHIKARELISQYAVGWVGEGTYRADNVSQVLFTIKEVTQSTLQEVRRLFYNFPFSWLELITREGNYHVFLNIPSQYLNLALHYLNRQLNSITESVSVKLFDPFESLGFPLPLKMFDDKKKWVFNEAQTIRQFESFFLRSIEISPVAFPRILPANSERLATNIPI